MKRLNINGVGKDFSVTNVRSVHIEENCFSTEETGFHFPGGETSGNIHWNIGEQESFEKFSFDFRPSALPTTRAAVPLLKMGLKHNHYVQVSLNRQGVSCWVSSFFIDKIATFHFFLLQ